MNEPRIAVKVSEEFRNKLKAALALKGTNITKWFKVMGQKEIQEAESKKS
jgi:hypothetical protein